MRIQPHIQKDILNADEPAEIIQRILDTKDIL